MKTFVLHICVFSLIYLTSAKALQLKQKLLATRQDLNECINKSNITSDEMFSIYEILNDTYKESGNEERIRKHGCIYYCVLEKVGAMERSEIIVDKMYSEVRRRVAEQSSSKVNKMVDNCINTVKNVRGKCLKAFDLVVCLLKAEFQNVQQASGVNEEHTQNITRNIHDDDHIIFEYEN